MDKDINLEENVEVSVDNDNSQNSFLQSTLGQVINSAIDVGLRAVLPDVIEDEVISIKDTLVSEGLSEAVSEAVNSAIDLGKSAIGIVTGNFESVSQAEKAVESGGIIDGVSDAIDFVLDKVSDYNLLSDTVVNLIKNGKDALLNNVSSNIKNEFEVQSDNIENLSSYTESWKEAFEKEDLDQMEEYMDKITETLEETLPIEELINEARTIENLHNLIENNGGDFDLSDEELELANMLS